MAIIPFILLLLTAVFFVLYMSKRLAFELHMLQLNSYRNGRYGHWYKEHFDQALKVRNLLPLIAILICLLTRQLLIALVASAVIYILLFFTYRQQPEKKPLVMTARARRLFITAMIITVAVTVFFLLFGLLTYRPFWSLWPLGVITVFPCAVMFLANIIMAPKEKAINNYFLNDAKNIIRSMPFLTTVAITGSYGKTSCKMILGDVLSEEFMTLVTPSSFNTPMGLTRVIRESLRPTHEMFVAEMGAKQPRDIKELCELVNPKVGILTAVGPQHLETFHTLENVINTKFELVESIPEDGFAVLNFDDENIRRRAQTCNCRIITYGLDSKWDYYAEQIAYDSSGSSFTIYTPDGTSQHFTTLLLGKHNIYNIVAAVATAHQLGLSLEKAAKAVKRLLPIEHRLQFIPHPGTFNVIDDAFNSNPQGAAAALEVLACFKEGKRIIVTPGMVELGEREYELNKAFAIQAATVCDYIILVGKKHSQPLQDGLKEAAYPEEKYYVAADLNDARRCLAKIAQVGDVVLFENDLPDTYNE